MVNDNSTDRTGPLLQRACRNYPELRCVDNDPPNGFGFAVRRGMCEFRGDIVAVVMADGSDNPEDIVRFYREFIATGVDCVFGSRFTKGAELIDYPRFKLVLNRLANLFIRILFGIRYNDVTNAFKMYRAHVIQGMQPLLSHHFNLTVEMPLKAIIRGYSFSVLPNNWTNRAAGESKLQIREMGSRYLFIVIYCLVEKWLSRGDYKASDAGRIRGRVTASSSRSSRSVLETIGNRRRLHAEQETESEILLVEEGLSLQPQDKRPPEPVDR